MEEIEYLRRRVAELENALKPSRDPRWSPRNWVISGLQPGVRELLELLAQQYASDHPNDAVGYVCWRAAW